MANYPPYLLSAAPEFIALSRRAGLIPDEWQQNVLTPGLGMDKDGRWTASRCSLWVPRQNGKGGVIEILELGWLFLLKERLIIHSAHRQGTAMGAYERMEVLIRGTPELHRLVRPYGDRVDKAGYRKSHAEQQIELHDGRVIQYKTRTATGARGLSAPKLIIDEAQEATEDQMAATLPTLSAMPNYQVWFMGTPPREATAWCYGLREDGEAGVPRLAHFDWGLGDEDGSERSRAIIDDPESVWRANPALGGRILWETTEDERRPSGLGKQFPAERLGMWKPVGVANSSVDPAKWKGMADAGSKRDGAVAIGVDVALDRDWSAIVVYGHREDGAGHAQVVSYEQGTAGLVERLRRYADALNPVAVAMGRGTYASLREALTEAGFQRPEDRQGDEERQPRRGDLAVLAASDMAAGCGQLIDAVRQQSFRYVPSDVLNRSVLGARTRMSGDAMAWQKADPNTDVSACVALTEARWAFYARLDVLQMGDYDPLADLF